MYFSQKSFIERVKLSLQDKEELKTPILIKSAESAKQSIKQITRELELDNTPEMKKKLLNDMKLFELGLYGEESVLFELTNAFLPIHILHDVQLTHGELKAQIDFLVITRKFILVIEVKNFYGNIEVTDQDEFIRNVMRGRKNIFHEGFYSPIRQAERQVEILRSLMQHHGVIGKKTPIKYVVAFSNKKTILHLNKAREEIRNKIVRADGLVHYISKELSKSSPVLLLDNRMKEISTFLKEAHQEEQIQEHDVIEVKLLEETVAATTIDVPEAASSEKLDVALRQYRKDKSAELGVKAFYVFTNQTLEHILEKQPGTRKELLDIRGIGKTKIEEFGEDIIQIVNQYK